MPNADRCVFINCPFDNAYSDLAGITRAVLSWLSTRPNAMATPTPTAILASLSDFADARSELVHEWGSEVPWRDIVAAASKHAPQP